MRQVWITRPGPPEVLETRTAPDPIPRAGEVRIRVAASGVNFADAVGRMGLYQAAPAIPYVPGFEVAGTVEAVSQGVPDLMEGDEVLALTRFGGYADLICVPHRQVFRRLEWMTASDGAALPVNYLTAYVMLVVMGSLRPGDRVLIHNAGGGVGVAALDVCRIVGAETVGTASAHKHAFLRQRGLGHAIDYRQQDYTLAVQEVTGGEGFQVILDPLGGIHWRQNYALLAPTGRLVYFGASSLWTGRRRRWWALVRGLLQLPFFTPLRLMQDNRAVMGVHLGRLWDQAARMRPWMQQIIAWYDEALFRPHIDRHFPLAEAAAAHEVLHERQNLGKLLLIP